MPLHPPVRPERRRLAFRRPWIRASSALSTSAAIRSGGWSSSCVIAAVTIIPIGSPSSRALSESSESSSCGSRKLPTPVIPLHARHTTPSAGCGVPAVLGCGAELSFCRSLAGSFPAAPPSGGDRSRRQAGWRSLPTPWARRLLGAARRAAWAGWAGWGRGGRRSAAPGVVAGSCDHCPLLEVVGELLVGQRDGAVRGGDRDRRA
jgi:hypothetical protein